MKDYAKDKMAEYKMRYGKQWREKWEAFEKTQQYKFAVEMASAGISIRGINCALNIGATSWDELARRTESDLRRVPNMGKKSIAEVVAALSARGLALAGARVHGGVWRGWQLGYVD